MFRKRLFSASGLTVFQYAAAAYTVKVKIILTFTVTAQRFETMVNETSPHENAGMFPDELDYVE